MTAYGFATLRLKSARPIPGLSPTRDVAGGEVEIHLDPAEQWPVDAGRSPRELWFKRDATEYDEESRLTVWMLANGAFFHFCYGDGIEFLVDRAGTTVWAAWPDRWTAEDACTYLFGPILGFVLRLRGATCLHASAVVIDGAAFAIAGPGGSGKSTTAAVFARAGYHVLCDDLLVLGEHHGVFSSEPSYPRVGLWADSVEAVFGSPGALRLQTPNWEKRYLDLRVDLAGFQAEPVPLHAVYVLGQRSDDPAAPYVDAVPPARAVTELVANAYVAHLLDALMRARDFEVFARLASAVPVRCVVPRADLGMLPALLHAIVDDRRHFGSSACAGAGAVS